MNKDSKLLAEAYDEILEEGWKSKLGGLAAAGLGAAAMWPVADKPNVAVPGDPHGNKFDNVELAQSFQNTGKLTQLIQQYYKLSGKDVKVQIQGDNIVLTSAKGTQTLALSKLMLAVDTSRNNGDSQKLSGYLAERL